MDHHARRLVHHKQVIILIDDVERDVLGNDFGGVTRTVHHDLHHIAGTHLVVRLLGLAVDQDVSGIGSILYAVAACAYDTVHQELIDAQRSLSPVGHESEVFEQLLLPDVAGYSIHCSSVSSFTGSSSSLLLPTETTTCVP